MAPPNVGPEVLDCLPPIAGTRRSLEKASLPRLDARNSSMITKSKPAYSVLLATTAMCTLTAGS
eukprot:6842810-Pyramimonas_sp.AAC.1